MTEPVVEGGGAEERKPAPPRPRASDQPHEQDLSPRWRKIEILGRPVSAFLTAIVVAAIGFWGQGYLSTRELEITRRTAIEQDTRLYSEIMSRREQSESSLRKDMFNAILARFLNAAPSGDDTSTAPPQGVDLLPIAETRLLKLELLALNFGDSLSLSPLFLQLEREIESIAVKGKGARAREDKTELLERLRSLARRISSAQLASLSSVGETIRFQVPIAEVTAGNVYEWPADFVEASQRDLDESDAWAMREKAIQETLELEGIERTYAFTFKHAYRDDASVLVELVINATDQPEAESPEEAGAEKSATPLPPTEMSFELNFFNFPLIDNTRLSGDQRFALVLESFDTSDDSTEPAIQVVGISFPGMYASLRDRPFLDDILARLRTWEEEVPAAQEDSGFLEGITASLRGLYGGEEAPPLPEGEEQK